MKAPSLTRDQKVAMQADTLKEQQDKQRNGEIEMIPGNKSSKSIDELAKTSKLSVDGKFLIPENESEGYVHTFTRRRHLQQTAKTILFEDRIITLRSNEYDRKVAEGFFQTYDDTEIIHDPRNESNASLKVESIDVDKVGSLGADETKRLAALKEEQKKNADEKLAEDTKRANAVADRNAAFAKANQETGISYKDWNDEQNGVVKTPVNPVEPIVITPEPVSPPIGDEIMNTEAPAPIVTPTAEKPATSKQEGKSPAVKKVTKEQGE